ncbi:succinate dehydrogenase, hydrophobic membrane anchor protein [Ketogulonicigenium robustum]|uniref:Succinate dehydrogenase, hydrophobic membrane anchor protein n=1 Tax=Ketogulonicigenium robustum TaxID=92947 RepID=A0A1W6NWB4_9RHOB|nr:succinate dehydrogenase [Ketogulonicigenium robustum]ARO13494.1 succinate dehydrogenase, hydrophobic membrane anchor protein [Ketogulonicigenium robustum]
MRYLTDRKRAVGNGASRTGTLDHIFMTTSAYGLLLLVPCLIWVLGHALFLPFDQARLYLARPFPIIVLGMTLVVGMRHFAVGAQMMIEDYLHGYAREVAVMLARGLSWLLIATGILALVRLALGQPE